MKEVFLILAVLGIFAYIYFLISKLDIFLKKNHKAILQEQEKREPSCIILTDDLSDEELLKEIRTFRDHHANANIVLYDDTDTNLQNKGK